MSKNTGFPDLRFLYVGSSDVGGDLDYHLKVLGAAKIWDRSAFGTRVAAVKLCDGPLVLLAGHRRAPSCMPIFEIENIQMTVKALEQRGWRSEGGQFEIPNSPCYLFKDPSGNELAIFEDARPRVFGDTSGE